MERVSRKAADKRNFVRLKTDTAAEVLICSLGKRFKAICRDLSGGGMSLESKVGLRAGTELEVKLASHYGDNPMLKARTKVAQIRRAANGHYILGLEITEILD